jgi:hypothetical protein
VELFLLLGIGWVVLVLLSETFLGPAYVHVMEWAASSPLGLTDSPESNKVPKTKKKHDARAKKRKRQPCR